MEPTRPQQRPPQLRRQAAKVATIIGLAKLRRFVAK
jgi:hypothetical protein